MMGAVNLKMSALSLEVSPVSRCLAFRSEEVKCKMPHAKEL